MSSLLGRSIPAIAATLRSRAVSAAELLDEALGRHARFGEGLHAYKHVDEEGAWLSARRADEMLARGDAPALCGIPVSVKDLYGAQGMPTFAGTARRLPEAWESDGWLVARLRAQGAVMVGKTHTVELAYGAVGINPHWGTPRNPWDAQAHRIPGGSSCGAGVSLWEGSALLALGSDTGGSIRIPASMTGVVGHKTTKGRWPTTGVVPLSSTLDTVGALARTVEDTAYFFGAVDPALGEPGTFVKELKASAREHPRIAIPEGGIWGDCQADIAGVIHGALDELASAGWRLTGGDGILLDEGQHLYMHGGIAGAECRAFLQAELPGWLEILHPTVGLRLAGAPELSSELYAASMAARETMAQAATSLFRDADLLVLPTALMTPPTVAELDEPDAYLQANVTALQPTCPVSMLGLCAVTLPVGLDAAGLPVGLQLVAPGGADEELLGSALAAEGILGSAAERLGAPPGLTG
jgi:aspartyl-tRNA(Asn)/glutamyl-tRNA(Gln) amidotransferase subunit A